MLETGLRLIALLLLVPMVGACAADADKPNIEPPTTQAPTTTISADELLTWCREHWIVVGNVPPERLDNPSEEWMRRCEFVFEQHLEYRASKEAADSFAQEQLSDAEIVWCWQHAADVLFAADALGLEGAPSAIDDPSGIMNPAASESWFVKSPEEYIRACSAAFEARS